MKLYYIVQYTVIIALWHIFVAVIVNFQGFYQQIFTCLGYKHAFYIVINKKSVKCHCNRINLNVVILFFLKGVYFEKWPAECMLSNLLHRYFPNKLICGHDLCSDYVEKKKKVELIRDLIPSQLWRFHTTSVN